MAGQLFVRLLRRSLLYRPLRGLAHRYVIQRWRLKGRPLPPPALLKQKLVQEYGRRYGLQTLVETGTARGKMVRGCLDHFQRIVSIELDPDLHRQAKARFAGQEKVTLLEGDSGELLAEVLAELSEAALFWLDAHFMVGGIRPPQVTPVVQELEHILAHPIHAHVILIDDARLFHSKSEYPTIEEVKALVESRYPRHSFVVEDDVIRICPP